MDGAKSEKPPDPLGKQALYRVPTVPGRAGDTSAEGLTSDSRRLFPSSAEGRRCIPGRRSGDATARVAKADEVAEPDHAESPAAVGSGSFTVRCQRCRQVSHVGLLNLLIFQFPIGVWLPRGQFDRRMTCPSCRKRSWCSVTLRRG